MLEIQFWSRALTVLAFDGLEPFQRNLLVLAVYAIIVTFVGYKIWEDVADYISVQFDRAALDQQLAETGLQARVGLTFKLADRYKPADFCRLNIAIANYSKTDPLYINWERSTIANLQGESQRAIRILPGGIDLGQRQVAGVVAPGRKLEEQLTTEEALRPDPAGNLVPGGPLLSSGEIASAIASQKPFTLRLVVELPGPATQPGRDFALLCHFRLSQTPLKRALYWR